LVEVPGERQRLTDLDWVEPEVWNDSQDLIFTVRLPFGDGCLLKIITISLVKEQVSFWYEFNNVTHEITSLNRIPNSLFFRNVHAHDIIAIIDNIKNKSAPINTYSVKIIKAIKHIISSVISNIINKSSDNKDIFLES